MNPTRRELIGLLGTGVAASLAGCSSSTGGQSPTPVEPASGGEDSGNRSDPADDGRDDGDESPENSLDTDADWQLVDDPPALETERSQSELEASSLTRAFGSVEAYTSALENADAVDSDTHEYQTVTEQPAVLVYHQGYGRNGCYDLTLGSLDRDDTALSASFQTKNPNPETTACTMAIVTPAKLLVVPMESVPESVTVNGESVPVET